MAPINLSKSKLLLYRQCPKRLWLDIHHPELRVDAPDVQSLFSNGHLVGELAQRLYDPLGKGRLVDRQHGAANALARTQALLGTSHPIFEAGFAAQGAFSYADILLPLRTSGKRAWRMIEVKSSGSVKDYHHHDAAIQSFIALQAGLPLAAISIAHIDTAWTYPGNGDYEGLLLETDVSQQAGALHRDIPEWIAGAQDVARLRKEPPSVMGKQCKDPYPCSFSTYCSSKMQQAAHPLQWLPNPNKTIRSVLERNPQADMREVHDTELNDLQRRVKHSTIKNKVYFDAAGAAERLAAYKWPAYFLDFETVQFAVPIWKGTRPYQQIPFQFSLHVLNRNGKLKHHSFLDLSGKDPSRAIAQALIQTCGERGPVFAFNASFEARCIKELAARFPRLKRELLAISERLVDLLPIAREHYYHPSQQGSWSLKKLLPAIAPELRYDELNGVQNGGMAMDVYREAILSQTSTERRREIEQQLLDYCELDTYATVNILRGLKKH